MSRYNYLAETTEERDEGFINALCEDIGRLQECGFPNSQIKRMIGTLPYVRIWCNQPGWLVPVSKLPKGYKWTDGEKYRSKGERTYYLLEIGEDLYIKGWTLAGQKAGQKLILKIPNWKAVPFTKIDAGAGGFLRDCLIKKWHEKGLDLGHTIKAIKEVRYEKRSNHDIACHCGTGDSQ